MYIAIQTSIRNEIQQVGGKL